MKIRIMGTKSECEYAQKFYANLKTSDIVESISISTLYPNRGRNTIFRVYAEITYKNFIKGGD